MRPSCSSTLVCTPDVDLHNQVPVIILHVLEADIPEDTGIVNEYINATKGFDSSLNDLVSILDRVVVADSVASSGLDLLDNNIGGL